MIEKIKRERKIEIQKVECIRDLGRDPVGKLDR